MPTAGEFHYLITCSVNKNFLPFALNLLFAEDHCVLLNSIMIGEKEKKTTLFPPLLCIVYPLFSFLLK